MKKGRKILLLVNNFTTLADIQGLKQIKIVFLVRLVSSNRWSERLQMPERPLQKIKFLQSLRRIEEREKI